jgi:Cu+-exporting ATPase
MGGIAVTIGSAGLIAGLAYYFFGPKKAGKAELKESFQEIEVVVKGGYDPSVIRVQEGVPLRIVFDRRETGECSSHVVFPDFMLDKALPPYQRTTVALVPASVGEFAFACGMNMLHGTRNAGRNGEHLTVQKSRSKRRTP